MYRTIVEHLYREEDLERKCRRPEVGFQKLRTDGGISGQGEIEEESRVPDKGATQKSSKVTTPMLGGQKFGEKGGKKFPGDASTTFQTTTGLFKKQWPHPTKTPPGGRPSDES